MLLDQTVVSGVGNIYADEALWAARIHPETPARALSTRAVNRLLAEVRAVLEKALAEGGTSFDAQYVNVNGQAGYFAHSLNAYGRSGRAVPALRPADRAGVVHEPLEPLLPALPAEPPPEGAGQRLTSTFFHAPAYDAGTKPSASLMSSMWRFSSALNVETRGDSGTSSRQRSRFAHFTIVPRRCPRCSLSTSVPYWWVGAGVVGGDDELVVRGDPPGRHVLHARDRDRVARA